MVWAQEMYVYVYMSEKYLRERDGRHGQEKIKTTTIFWESAVSYF